MTVAKLRALLRRVYKKTAGSAPLDLFLLGQESKTEVIWIRPFSCPDKLYDFALR